MIYNEPMIHLSYLNSNSCFSIPFSTQHYSSIFLFFSSRIVNRCDIKKYHVFRDRYSNDPALSFLSLCSNASEQRVPPWPSVLHTLIKWRPTFLYPFKDAHYPLQFHFLLFFISQIHFPGSLAGVWPWERRLVT